MEHPHRHLPHYLPTGVPLFLTFRLAGSLPEGRSFPQQLTSGQQFLILDRMLDHARTGPFHLKDPNIAMLVEEDIQSLEKSGNALFHAWVIMPNHVHLLVTCSQPVSTLLHQLKGSSARYANLILGRTGEFWQQESYDWVVRDADEYRRILRYIENNPVKAGLAPDAGRYRWSSAFWQARAGERKLAAR